MALSVTDEKTVVLSEGVLTEILDTQPGRASFAVQLQGPGEVWIGFTDPAAVGEGFRVGPWERKRGEQDFTTGRRAAGPPGAPFSGPVYAIYRSGAGEDLAPSTGSLRVLEVV